MAKTIMVSNDVYEKLKSHKGERSFSALFEDLLSPTDKKLGGDLRACLGTIPDDAEWRRIEADLRRGWKKWNDRYA